MAVLFFCIISCVNDKHQGVAKEGNDIDSSIMIRTSRSDTLETGKIISKVLCKEDPSQSYSLYIPAKNNNETLTVIYFFDPHGDGSLPLVKYKTLADEYHFILVGSNNSKNGIAWPTSEKIWNILSDDIQKRLVINTNRIYTCGFSGGAKVATLIALNHAEVKGVIANGAGMPDITHAGNFQFSFTAVTGYGDMNMTDLVAINNDLANTQTHHRIIFFEGKHEWAPENTMRIAFAGLQLDAMREKLIAFNDLFVNNYITQSKERILTFLKDNNYLYAERESELSINMLDGLTKDVSWFINKEAAIKNNPVYKKQWLVNKNLFATEQNIKAVFDQQFQKEDINYWTKTIKEVQLKAKAKTAEGAMYQRLQAYLSLAFYSISNQLIEAAKNEEAEYFVSLYKKSDPDNSEAWYFSAILDARYHNAKAAEEDLLIAVKNGFSDKTHLMQQPEFQSPEVHINLSEIESKMKN
jgi:pimeloyl-ACP methyl ester carboxylesterase